MRKILYILLTLPLFAFGQVQDSCYSVADYNLQIQEANPPITIDLASGWNMFGYSCRHQKNAKDLFANISDKIVVIKNNVGSVYLREYDYNGLGNLIPNQGYQIKMYESVFGLEICSYHINFHQVAGCTDCEANNFNQLASVDDGSCTYNFGCTDALAYNYNSVATLDDGSCIDETNVLIGCMDEDYLEFNSSANVPNLNFCLTEKIEGCTDFEAQNFDPLANVDDDSCLGETIYGCMNETAVNYNPNATEEASENCVIHGCTLDIFPNYNSEATLDDGSCSPFASDVYGCTDTLYAEFVDSANVDNGSCLTLILMDCMDSSACNFNADANMADDSCTYPEQGYDCDGYVTAEIGGVMEGGYLFYIDETGKHGLVAALEDLTEGATDPYGWGYNGYEWGCYGHNVNGADGQAIGTGYQNTLDIINQGCTTENGGITAAQAALNAEINGYSDWYLPSKDELKEMYNTIGNGGSEGNIGGFDTRDLYYYSSSSEYDYNHAWYVDFGDFTGASNNPKYGVLSVRVIRAF